MGEVLSARRNARSGGYRPRIQYGCRDQYECDENERGSRCIAISLVLRLLGPEQGTVVRPGPKGLTKG